MYTHVYYTSDNYYWTKIPWVKNSCRYQDSIRRPLDLYRLGLWQALSSSQYHGRLAVTVKLCKPKLKLSQAFKSIIKSSRALLSLRYHGHLTNPKFLGIAQRHHTRLPHSRPRFDSQRSQKFFSWNCWDLLTALLRTVVRGLIMSSETITILRSSFN